MGGKFWPRLAFGAVLISGSTSAAIFEVNDRTAIARSDPSPYSPIGVVNGGLFRKYSTGFLIDPCHVLTVQHVLGEGIPAIGRRITFKGGITTSHPLKSGGTVIASGGYEQQEKHHADMPPVAYASARAADWMVARLDQCLGRKLGYVRLRDSSAIPLPLRSAGFPGGAFGRSSMKLDPECSVRGGSTSLLLNDCAALPGNSGSPIFREVSEENGTVLEVYAMQSAAEDSGTRAHPFVLSHANVATPVSQILPRIAEVMPLYRSQQLAVAK